MPDPSQSKRPPSISAPPIAIPWPPIHLVSECMTISAPNSNGGRGRAWRRYCRSTAVCAPGARCLRSRDVEHLEARIADGLADHQARVGAHGGSKTVDVPRFTKLVVMPKRGRCATAGSWFRHTTRRMPRCDRRRRAVWRCPRGSPPCRSTCTLRPRLPRGRPAAPRGPTSWVGDAAVDIPGTLQVEQCAAWSVSSKTYEVVW